MKKIVILICIIAIIVILTTAFVIYQKTSKVVVCTIPESITNYVMQNSAQDNNLPTSTDNNDLPEKNFEKTNYKNELSDFDLSFLKLENNKNNLIYSPLSIKYALKMLEEATDGESKNQIAKLIGDYTPNKYKASENMSLANGLFVRNSFKKNVKQQYIDLLRSKYDAEVKFDDFNSAQLINDWVKEKTLEIIPKVLEDGEVEALNFALVNALAIDMEWEEKFLPKSADGNDGSFFHENFGWSFSAFVSPNTFQNMEEKISGMDLETVINNYDIVKELGEDNIRKTVGDEYTKFLYNDEELENYYGLDYVINEVLGGERTEETVKKEVNSFLDRYIEEIDSNYGRLITFHHFALADNENEKVFVKDLKEYDGTTLQYIGIMPKSGTLGDYINGKNSNDINQIILTAKELKNENFKQGVITEIIGHIPKFKFEYNLDLVSDLKKQGVVNVFESGKAGLTSLTDMKEEYISDAIHMANIEFTQDGIKAAAATMLGGEGAGDWFDYFYDVPVEKIDMTFDKPYMFIIRDKETGEVWFVGTVYEPLLWEQDETKSSYGDIY